VITSFLVLDPDFTIAEASDAYRRATLVWNEEICGRGIFDAFPDNPQDPESSGVGNLRASLEQVRNNGQPHRMEIQRYDVRDFVAGSAVWIEKYWAPVNRPVCGGDGGEVTHIVHQVTDVTPAVQLLRWVDQQEQAILAELQSLRGMHAELHAQQRQYQSLRRTIAEILHGKPTGDHVEDIQTRFSAPVERRYYCTANRVPISGIYELFHRRECRWPVSERTLLEGQRFPHCAFCRDDVLYRLLLRHAA
jgi:hypothetical protein